MLALIVFEWYWSMIGMGKVVAGLRNSELAVTKSFELLVVNVVTR